MRDHHKKNIYMLIAMFLKLRCHAIKSHRINMTYLLLDSDLFKGDTILYFMYAHTYATSYQMFFNFEFSKIKFPQHSGGW
jgi:hypothetical protein